MVSYLPTNLPYKKSSTSDAKYTKVSWIRHGNEIQIMKLDRFLQFHQVTQFWFQQKNRLPITNKHTVIVTTNFKDPAQVGQIHLTAQGNNEARGD